MESPYKYKVDFRRVASSLLQLSPIVLAVTYILEYSYVFQFLSQFSVTPEEVGISEIKLLSRAATLTLAAISVYVVLAAIPAGVYAVWTSIAESSRIQGATKKLRRTKKSPARKQDSITSSLREASQRAESVRDASVASFGLVFILIVLSLKPLGIQLSVFAKVVVFAAIVILTVTLFAGWRSKAVRYLTFACGISVEISLLALAVITGGFNTGVSAASTGNVPSFIELLGADISQVHPEWLNSKIVPSQYTQDQDLLEIGSDTETTFLYDCKTDTTYRIPLSDVVLAYPSYPNQTSSAILRRLHCSSGNP